MVIGDSPDSDTMCVLLRAYVTIPPEGLDAGWRQYILHDISSKYKNACLPKCGFITAIRDIAHIDDLIITSISGSVRCLVDFYATALFPCAGTRIEARVDLISQHGMLLSHPYVMILIPFRQMILDGYEIRHSFSAVRFVSPQRTIAPHNLVSVELTHVRFENHRFSALAKIDPKDS